MAYRLLVLTALLLVGVCAVAEQPGCVSFDIPVNVLQVNGNPVEGLSMQDFSLHAKKDWVALESVSQQAGPRRIVFVIDTSRKLSPDARRLEVEFANGILAAAQPEDTFGLLTARGVTQTVKPGSDREAVKKALEVLANAAAENGDGSLGPLDAVMEAAGWFEQPQLGDAIVVMAADLEGNHKTNSRSIAKLLLDRRIRLFGVALGFLQLSNSVTSGMTLDRDGFGYRQPGMPLHNVEGDPNFLPLSVDSGGYLAPENTRQANLEFKLNEAKKQQIHKTGELMAKLIDSFYAFHVKAPSRPEPLTVSLSPGKLQALPGSHLLYPHNVPGCATSVAGK
jgi:hypothetical protein